jgi:serine acetyltransferase
VTHDGGVWVLRGLCKDMEKADKFGRISVGNNVHIGTDVVIMPGVSIGNNVIVGVGAIVTKDIPDNSVAVGIPARVIQTVQEYKAKNLDKFDFTKGLSSSEKKQYLLRKYNEQSNSESIKN